MATAGGAGACTGGEDVVGETGRDRRGKRWGRGLPPAAAPGHRSLWRYLRRVTSGLECQPSTAAGFPLAVGLEREGPILCQSLAPLGVGPDPEVQVPSKGLSVG